MQYTLIRSKRKTLAVHIVKGGKVEVRAPLSLPIKDIERFLLQKQNWIHSHVQKILVQEAAKSQFTLNYGDTVLLMGKKIPILPNTSQKPLFNGNSFLIPKDLQSEKIKTACIQLYKQIAKTYLTQKTAVFSNRMNVFPRKVEIGSAKKRWGSCTSDQTIRYSWRLMMAEEDVIEYVVVHELAHIYQMNHSPQFWRIVAFYLPDYKQRQRKLKQLEQVLLSEDW